MDGDGYRKRLQDAIEFIETNLTADLPLKDVSRQANVSLYHFHRLFRVYVGESLKEYIRHRRLAAAARELIDTRKPIIEIALDYQYSTPESFLRAFKAMFGRTPRSFRKEGAGDFRARHRKADLIRGKAFASKGASMEPSFIEKRPFTLVGELIHTSHGVCKEDVHGLWAKERADDRIRAFAGKAAADSIFGVCFGACDGCGTSLKADSELFPYLIGWEADDGLQVPEGFVRMAIPGGKYAVFTVEGDTKDIDRAVNRIYGTWLPASGHELSDSPVLERYGPAWNGARGTMEIWLPIA
ncbi:MAG TPA: AraC family transcriptional regulator [Spirochaetia bacterium]|nr:AraC family transcriptional regulator [Spirochaetia bacterium]